MLVDEVLAAMPVVALRLFIESAGQTHRDCLTKQDLANRATEAMATVSKNMEVTMSSQSSVI